MSKARELADVIGTQDTTENVLQGRRNLIINGGFDVWQRGTSFTFSSRTYTADRWYTFDGSISKGTQVMPEGYTTNSLDWTLNSTNMQFWQGVEDGHRMLKDRACIISVVLSCTSGSMSISPAFNGATITGTVWNVTTTPTRFTYSRSASDNSGLTGTNLYVGFDNLAGNNGTLKVSEFQLELGSVATPFEHRSYGEELALCQRYYQTTFTTVAPQNGASLTNSDTYYAPAWMHSSNSGTVGSRVEFAVPMRTVPTITYYNSTNVSSNNGIWGRFNGGWQDTGTMATHGLSSRGFCPTVTALSGNNTQNYLILGGYSAEAEL